MKLSLFLLFTMLYFINKFSCVLDKSFLWNVFSLKSKYRMKAHFHDAISYNLLYFVCKSIWMNNFENILLTVFVIRVWILASVILKVTLHMNQIGKTVSICRFSLYLLLKCCYTGHALMYVILSWKHIYIATFFIRNCGRSGSIPFSKSFY